MATHISFSLFQSPSTTAGSSLSALWAAPKVTPSRMDHMASRLRQVVIQLSMSATEYLIPSATLTRNQILLGLQLISDHQHLTWGLS